jgi:uncharacterized protein YecT (DUF1311 family)
MRGFALAVFLSVCLVPAHAASFDCSKAATAMEKAICGDQELSRLDEELASAYKAALKDKAHAAFIRKLQRDWLSQTRACATSGECIKERYRHRIATLRAGVVTSPAGKLADARISHTATRLMDGRVLIAGGEGGEDEDGTTSGALASAELYDPTTKRFSATGHLVNGRSAHLATLMPNGQVIMTGGESWANAGGPHGVYFNDVAPHEIYDPSTGTFRVPKDIPPGTPVALGNGKVLLISGNSAWLYDPVTQRTSAAGPPVQDRADGFTATRLADGRVLIAGGRYGSCATAELYDPASNTFSAAGSMSGCRAGHTATLLQDGRVLLTGGFDAADTAELYDVKTGSFTPAGKLFLGRAGHSALLLPDGTVLIAGGEGRGNYNEEPNPVTLERYDPASNTFSPVGSTGFACYHCSATALGNGKVLFVNMDTAEIYDWAAAHNARVE